MIDRYQPILTIIILLFLRDNRHQQKLTDLGNGFFNDISDMATGLPASGKMPLKEDSVSPVLRINDPGSTLPSNSDISSRSRATQIHRQNLLR